MRYKLFSLLLSFLLIGAGSVILFFEVSDYTYLDQNWTQGETTLISNTYNLLDINRIESSRATIVIDETQTGVKVDIRYYAKAIDIQANSYTYFYDCPTVEDSLNCNDNQSKKTLLVGYVYTNNRFKYNEVVSLVIDELKDKSIINLEKLFTPTITITVNSEHYKLIY